MVRFQGLKVAPASEWVVVALGANLGDARAHLRSGLKGLAALRSTMGAVLHAVSPLYRSAPWQTSGPDFLNAVALLSGPSDPDAPWTLLNALHAIENQAGRERPYRYAPRTLDLDLILYGSRAIESPRLQVPHPRALQRSFVLQPLLDMAPSLSWPVIGHRWVECLSTCEGEPPERVLDPEWPEGLWPTDPSKP